MKPPTTQTWHSANTLPITLDLLLIKYCYSQILQHNDAGLSIDDTCVVQVLRKEMHYELVGLNDG